MPFNEVKQFSEAERDDLRAIARQAIEYGLSHGTKCPVDLERLSQNLHQPGASFVTLQIQGQLRGCIGSLEAHLPLAQDVSDNAFNAAFQDPRFVPLKQSELNSLDIHISVLTPAQAMHFSSEQDLLRQLRPGIDGLLLETDAHRGTFLPSVWEALPEPEDFLRQLKLKAGLAPDYWSDDIRISRYETVYL